jgi:transposase
MHSQAVLSLAVELGWTEWTLGFSTGIAGAPRLRTMRARDLAALRDEIARAKQRFGVPEETRV